MNIYRDLNVMHDYLMGKGFPYSSVSVIHRHQDLGFHVFIMECEKERVTEDVKDVMRLNNFTHSFV